ncbi:MAG: STM4012 family radical SAM protein [Lachnospiraceae bacterium]
MNRYIQYMYSYPHKTAYRPMKGVRMEEYLHLLKDTTNGLYFHIPFCQTKCGYCNLFSVTGKTESECDRYIDAMERQAAQISRTLPDGVSFSDLTIGGGTPLYLTEQQLQRIFSIADKYFGFSKGDGPVIVETSPKQTTLEKLQLLKAAGATRVSIGVQSFHAQELKKLQRIHTPEDAKMALKRIREMEFSCMNLDLIYGIPGQTAALLQESLEEAMRYHPEELFVYPLYIKQGTRLSKQQVKTAENTYELYLFVREFLKAHGYIPYSMRRFVKAETIGQNPAKSCGFENTISIGCGGRSYIGNLHTCTPYSVSEQCCNKHLQEYMDTEDYLQVTNGYLLSEEEMRRRYVIKHVLFGNGINQQEYRAAFGSAPCLDYPILRDWVRQGYAQENGIFLGLTEEGFACSDYLGPMLISEEVVEKMNAWEEQ